MSDEIRIQFTRFSAFYSPLIATIAGGFLKEEGLEPKHSMAPPGKTHAPPMKRCSGLRWTRSTSGPSSESRSTTIDAA